MSFDPFAPKGGRAAAPEDPFAPQLHHAPGRAIDPFAPPTPLGPAGGGRKADGRISPTIAIEIPTDPQGRRKDIDNFQLVDDLRQLYDPFSFSIPNPEGKFNYMLAYRHYPITIWHSDPFVQDGQDRLMLKGIIVTVEQDTTKSGSVLRISGYDLGWLLTSCAPYWYNLKGKTWPRLCSDLLDDSWIGSAIARDADAVPRAETRTGRKFGRTDEYGFRAIVGVNFNPYLRGNIKNAKMQAARQEAADLFKLNLGREAIVQSLTYQRNQVIPRIQIQPGEPVGDVLVRYARLSKRLVNISAEGDIMFFVPDEKQTPSYVFNWHYDQRRPNSAIESVNYRLDGEPIYNDVTCVGSNIYPVVRPNQDDPNEGKFGRRKFNLAAAGPSSAPSIATPIASFLRRQSFADSERYTREMALTRAEWRYNQNLFEGETWTATVIGHSQAGIPLVSGTRAEIHDSKNGIDKTMLVSRVVRTQSRQGGSKSQITCKPEGLLGA